MRFSIAAVSAIVLASCATLTQADQYADAIKEWCKGLEVPYPDESAVFTAGSETKVTVKRVPDDHVKTVTGLDLYSVSPSGQAQYVKNVWHGSYDLNTQASISDNLSQDSAAGLYYYRVWVTNLIGGQHGPDCIETSHTFKVTTGSHTNADGSMQFSEALNDISYYHPDHFKGCFGFSVEYPQEGAVFTQGEHSRITAVRDTSSQTDAIKRVDLYKSREGVPDELVETVWTGEEYFTDVFNLKDHLVLPADKLDENASYYYALGVSSKKTDDECTFTSKQFKIKKAN